MKIDCIIPIYNEKYRIHKNLKQISKIRNLNNIICINDGSDDGTDLVLEKLKKEITNIIILNQKSNTGKTHAIKKGLIKASTDFVLLIDADLINITSKEFDNAINLITESTDQIILQRKNSYSLVRFFHFDLMLSGERIIKKEYLKNILLNKNITGYLLEVGINEYAINNNWRNMISHISVKNPKRKNKWGLRKSIVSNLKMFSRFLKYPGPINFIKQIIYFKRLKSKRYARA